MRSTRPAPRLASDGRPRRSLRRTPKLQSTPPTTDPTGQVAQANRGLLLRAIGAVLVVLALTSVGSWAALVATVTATPILDGRIHLVQRGAYPIGDVPAGTRVVVDDAPSALGITDRLADAFTGYQGVAVVDIATTPGQQITYGTDGQLLADTNPTGLRVSAPLPLREQTEPFYLGTCVRGACSPGAVVLVPQTHVLGTIASIVGGEDRQ